MLHMKLSFSLDDIWFLWILSCEFWKTEVFIFCGAKWEPGRFLARSLNMDFWLTFIWGGDHHTRSRRIRRCFQNWLQLGLIQALLLSRAPGLTWVRHWSCCSGRQGLVLVRRGAVSSGGIVGHAGAGIRGGWRTGCCVLLGWWCRLCGRTGPSGGATSTTHRAGFNQEEVAAVLRGRAKSKT